MNEIAVQRAGAMVPLLWKLISCEHGNSRHITDSLTWCVECGALGNEGRFAIPLTVTALKNGLQSPP